MSRISGRRATGPFLQPVSGVSVTSQAGELGTPRKNRGAPLTRPRSCPRNRYRRRVLSGSGHKFCRGQPSSVGVSPGYRFLRGKPARRSLALWPACSLHGQKQCVYLEGSDGFVTSTAAPIATGWSDPVAGWELHPRKTNTIRCGVQQSLTPDPHDPRSAQQRSETCLAIILRTNVH